MLKEQEQRHQTFFELQEENARLKKALQESREWFRKIFHASSNMMAIHTLRGKKFVDLNDAAASFGGYKREELIGHTLEEQGLLEDLQFLATVNPKLQAEGKAHNVETKLRTKSGEVRTVLASVDPITVDDEPCMLAVSVDITDREEKADALRKSEEVLKESEEYLNKIINCIGDPIFVMDREHRLVLVNNSCCAFAGMQQEELVGTSGQPVADSIHRWEQEEAVFKTGKEMLSEDVFSDAKGLSRTVMTKKTLLTDNNGNKQIIGVLRDITEYKKLEAQFLQSQKMEAVGVLAGGVAHDFNNLLNVINGYAELILDDLPVDNPVKKDIENIREAGQRAAALTSQLLAFSRKQILQPEIFDLNTEISRMTSMLQRMIGEDIELIFETSNDTACINADPGKIQQVIMNLVANARDAMPHGGKLTIETENISFDEGAIREHPLTKAGPHIMLAISDNGVGMDAATQARIFEPFFTTKEKGKGTGLGLSTVYGIVKQSNGFVWVYSEPGKGTTIKAYFPNASAPAAAAPEPKSGITHTGIETILVVEDEKAVREIACRILRSRGYNVLEAENGVEALRLAQNYEHHIHLAVTDVVMPGIGGKTVIARLEKFRPGIKALFISGYTENAIVHHGILDSGVDFLPKPFTADGLARKIREMLDKI